MWHGRPDRVRPQVEIISVSWRLTSSLMAALKNETCHSPAIMACHGPMILTAKPRPIGRRHRIHLVVGGNAKTPAGSQQGTAKTHAMP